ncbi:YIP1 family protein [Pseudoruegeria sp. SK021]|uniref:YIP1 family protein n=1 Tax=Pseudoruegeria sp. SK021 TaxID=1933035 RepID=UPI000A24D591|nr:YIP1 family protein [Pseudoruegeria sp. SK021]OSP55586.1 YIP1 family protein [Pseudoruegeria sp. SK021]
MSVTSDMLAAYRHPRRVVRRQLQSGVRDDRALVYLMLACGMIFVAQWPRLSRDVAMGSDVPMDAMIGATMFSWVFFMPLVFYLLAALSHLVARMFGGGGTWFSARFALFWTLLVVSPIWLLQGLVAGFIGAGPALTATGALLLGVFSILWISALIEAEQTPDRKGNGAQIKERA